MSLYYCMSNTQLRNIVYAYGKSEASKNKAATILRVRRKGMQQQVSSSGFQLNFIRQINTLTHLLEQKFTKFNNTNLKNCQSSIKRTFNFSKLSIERAGSLNLQGQHGHHRYLFGNVINKNIKTNNYGKGKRRITKERPCIISRLNDEKQSEDVLSSTRLEQPVPPEDNETSINNQNNKDHKTNSSVYKMSEEATSMLKTGRGLGLKPVSATLYKFAGYTMKVILTGLICLTIIFVVLIILLILLKIIATNPQYLLYVAMMTIIYKIIGKIKQRYHKPTLAEIQQTMLRNSKSRFIDRFGNDLTNMTQQQLKEYYDPKNWLGKLD